MPCCRCNGSNAICKGCSCMRKKIACTDCYPCCHGKCRNLITLPQPPLPSTSALLPPFRHPKLLLLMICLLLQLYIHPRNRSQHGPITDFLFPPLHASHLQDPPLGSNALVRVALHRSLHPCGITICPSMLKELSLWEFHWSGYGTMITFICPNCFNLS